jgi:hypothetical protein
VEKGVAFIAKEMRWFTLDPFDRPAVFPLKAIVLGCRVSAMGVATKKALWTKKEPAGVFGQNEPKVGRATGSAKHGVVRSNVKDISGKTKPAKKPVSDYSEDEAHWLNSLVYSAAKGISGDS